MRGCSAVRCSVGVSGAESANMVSAKPRFLSSQRGRNLDCIRRANQWTVNPTSADVEQYRGTVPGSSITRRDLSECLRGLRLCLEIPAATVGEISVLVERHAGCRSKQISKDFWSGNTRFSVHVQEAAVDFLVSGD